MECAGAYESWEAFEEGSVENRRRRPDTAVDIELGRGIPQLEANVGVDVPELGFDDDVRVRSL